MPMPMPLHRLPTLAAAFLFVSTVPLFAQDPGRGEAKSEARAEARATGSQRVTHRVVVVNGAQGGQPAEDIDDPAAPYWTHVDGRLSAAGVSAAQVQAIWMLEANSQPTDPFPDHAQSLSAQLATIAGILRERFPNARVCYLGARIYAGYATTALNPEPYAFEQGFANKWLVAAQMAGEPGLNFDPDAGPVEAPWITWGPYMWADGLVPRSDGLIWECSDLAPDGTHPSPQGAAKVAAALLAFAHADATMAWYRGEGGGD